MSVTWPAKQHPVGKANRLLALSLSDSQSLTDAQYPSTWTPLNKSLLRRQPIGDRSPIPLRGTRPHHLAVATGEEPVTLRDMRLRADHCRADEPVRLSQSSDLGGPLVFPAQAAVPLTSNRYRRLRRPFAARSLRRRCCRAEMRWSRALDAVPRHRARACGLPRCAERRGPPRRRQPSVAVLVGRR